MKEKMETAEAYRPYIEGERIHLRAVLPTDATERYAKWMNDPDVNRFLESRFKPSTQESIAHYIHDMGCRNDCLFLAIVQKSSGVHIGNIKIGAIDWIHRFADVSILIGDKSCWRRGFGTDAIQLVVRFAFNTIHLHKLTANVYRGNISSIKAFKKAGFAEEGIRREQRFFEGSYTDEILLGLVNKDDAKSM